MTLLNKIITRYVLVATFVSLSCYVVKLDGAECFSEIVNLDGAEDSLVSRCGWSVREGRRLRYRMKKPDFMEDRCITKELNGKLTFVGVYDGHGGSVAADYVKEHLHKNFSEAQAKTIAEKLKIAFLKTDEDFLKDPKFKEDKSGTTAAVVVIDTNTNKLVGAHCGDSRAMLIRDGKVPWATQDHKPDIEAERKRIEDAKGFVDCNKMCQLSNEEDDCVRRLYPPIGSEYKAGFCDHPARVMGALTVSRAFGDREYKEINNDLVIPDPDIYEEDTQEGDVFVLASDGFWDVIKNEEVPTLYEKFSNPNRQKRNIIIKGSKWLYKMVMMQNTGKEIVDECGDEQVRLVARALRDEAHKRGSTDNISVLIVKIGAMNSKNDRQKSSS